MPSVYCSGVISGFSARRGNVKRAFRRCGATLAGGERRLDVRAVFVREALEVDADAAPRIAVDALAVADQVAARQRTPQREHPAFGNLGLPRAGRLQRS